MKSPNTLSFALLLVLLLPLLLLLLALLLKQHLPLLPQGVKYFVAQVALKPTAIFLPRTPGTGISQVLWIPDLSYHSRLPNFISS